MTTRYADTDAVPVRDITVDCRNFRHVPQAGKGVWTTDVQITIEARGPDGHRLLGERVLAVRLWPMDEEGGSL